MPASGKPRCSSQSAPSSSGQRGYPAFSGRSPSAPLKGVLEREKEPVGILLALASPTKEMVTEAAASGFYENEMWQRKFPRVQIITVEEMLAGKRADISWGKAPFAKAPTEKERAQQETLL